MHVPSPLVLDGGPLSIDAVVAVARSRQRVAISDEAAARVRRSRAVIEHLLDTGAPMYGITTGFGALRGTAIPPDQREELQRNLIRSHASGMGPAFSEEVVRAAILLRANTLCQGYSGVRLALVEAFLAMLNADLYPYVPQQGSVGASGDLAPLSHLGLVLMGDPEGRVLRRDSVPNRPLPDAPPAEQFVPLAEAPVGGLEPITLRAKEGLAVNNGTTFMNALAALALHDAAQVLRHAELATAMSLEAQQGIPDAFLDCIHEARPQRGQLAVSRRIAGFVEGSEILALPLNSARLGRLRWHADRIAESEHAPDAAAALARTLADALDAFWSALDTDASALRELHPRDQIAALAERLDAPGGIRDLAERVAQSLRQSVVSDPTLRAHGGILPVLADGAVPESPEVQSDYSMRCAPQVLACALRAIEHAREVTETEAGSATDNPLVFIDRIGTPPTDDAPDAFADWLRQQPTDAVARAVVSGGNFHGQPLSSVMDYLAITMTTLASLSERRVAHLVDEHHSNGLPPFLILGSGLNSGFMLPQYTAAAIVSECKTLAHPASVDSIPTSAGTEDHVSMGTIAARKALQVVHNARRVVAIELLAAYQALWFRRPMRPGAGVAEAAEILDAEIGFYDDAKGLPSTDRVLYPDLAKVEALIASDLLAPSPQPSR